MRITRLSKMRMNFIDQIKHDHVPTIYHETLALLYNWKAKSIAAMHVDEVLRKTPISKWRRWLSCRTKPWVRAPSTTPRLASTSLMKPCISWCPFYSQRYYLRTDL